MINGIDLLFVLIGFILLLLLVEGWDRYMYWSRWNRDRRRERKCSRYELQDSFSEEEYRVELRMLLSDNVFSAVHKMTRSFDKWIEALRGETHAQ